MLLGNLPTASFLMFLQTAGQLEYVFTWIDHLERRWVFLVTSHSVRGKSKHFFLSAAAAFLENKEIQKVEEEASSRPQLTASVLDSREILSMPP